MWLTGLMCGLRPGEWAGLRWCYVDIDSGTPTIDIVERTLEVRDRYVGQAAPKTPRSKRRIGLHPLLVAALQRHRDEQTLLGLYDPEGFTFCTRNGTPMSMTNLRRAFRQLCARAGLGEDWTTYELRHSFVSLVADQLDDLVQGRRPRRPRRHAHDRGLPPQGPGLFAPAIDAWNRLLDQAGSSSPAEAV